MKPEELQVLMRKVEELRALMVLSQRTIPFLEDVFLFVKEIVPLLDVLRKSVECTTEKLPKASQQLNKVTSATEIASTEILNIVESMMGTVDSLRSDLEKRYTAAAAVRALLADMETQLRMLHDNGTRLPGVDGLETVHAALAARVLDLMPGESGGPVLDGMLNDCTNIMIALQVQDITAQQIAAVNTLMQSMDEGLTRLMRNFSESSAKHDATAYKHRHLDIVFDDSAEFGGGEERQRLADAVVEESQNALERQPVRQKRKRARK
jgi:chemotaxis regulatin CheY-phosphate phosphatase CheZ